MSLEDNKTLVREYFDQVVNRMKLDRLDDFVSADFINHGQGTESASGRTGPETLRQGIAALLSVLPDGQAVLEDLTAEDDKVVVRLHYEGTFQGRRVSLPGLITYRVAGGKLTERWGQIDLSGLASTTTRDSSTLLKEGKASGLGPPPRTLTPAMEAFAANSGWQMNGWLTIILGSVFTAVGLFLLVMAPRELAWSGWIWIAFTAAFLGGFFLFQRMRRRKVSFVLANGQVVNAPIRNNSINWSYKLNGAPQRIVEMEIAGKPFIWKTFDHNLADDFPSGVTVEILYHAKYPQTIIPTSRLTV